MPGMTVQAKLGAGDRGEEPTSPLTTLRQFYVAPGFTFDPDVEQRYLDGMLKTSVGDDVYPGDLTTSSNWPGVAPGTTGMNNALSPKYLDQSGFADLDPVPPVLWVRGELDQIVSDTSMFDLAQLARLGAVPGSPRTCAPSSAEAAAWAARPDGGAGAQAEGSGVASIASRAIVTMSPKVCSRSEALVSSPVTMWSETVHTVSACRRALAASV